MATDSVTSKVDRIAAELRREIEEGLYPANSVFPSQNELMRRFGVANHTVRGAVSHLAAEGYVEKVQGKGTFVRSRNGGGRGIDTASTLVGVVMRTGGHVFGNLFHQLSSRMYAQGLLPMVLDTTASDHMALAEARRWCYTQVESLIRRGIGKLVIDGDMRVPLADLARLDYESLVLIHRCEADVELPRCSRILSDYEEGGRLSAEHLLGFGHRKIALVTFRVPNCINIGRDYIRGAHRACEAAGLDPAEVFVSFEQDTDHERDRELSGRILEGGQFTAVMSLGDFRLECVYEAARLRGARIPGDLSLVGYYNTPWCRAFHPSLTSVWLRQHKMAELFQTALSEDGISAVVKPELMSRESVGAPG